MMSKKKSGLTNRQEEVVYDLDKTRFGRTRRKLWEPKGGDVPIAKNLLSKGFLEEAKPGLFRPVKDAINLLNG